jgi:acetyl esterase/lipase
MAGNPAAARLRVYSGVPVLLAAVDFALNRPRPEHVGGAGFDPLREEAIAYAAKLKAAGVAVTMSTIRR